MTKTCIKCGKKEEVRGPDADRVKDMYLICSKCLPLHVDDIFPYTKEAENE